MILETTKLSEVCKIISGNSIPVKEKEKDFTNVNGVPYVATKDISFDGEINYDNGIAIPQNSISKFRISPIYSTLICAEGGSAGRKIAFSEKQCCFVNKLYSIIPSNKIIPKFIYYYCLSEQFQKQFKNSLQGLIGGVSMKKINNFLISFPPLKEQNLIVSKLDILFDEIHKLIIKKKQIHKECKSLMENAIQRIFDKNFNNKKTVSLLSLCDAERGITYGVIKLGKEVSGGIPCLRTSNVKFRKIITDGLKSISPEISKKYERTILKGKEILVNIRGTLGGVALASEEMIGWNISREVALVPINEELANSQYVLYFISSKKSQSWLKENTRGAAYQGINLSDLRLLPIKLASKPEQNIIVEQIKSLILEMEKINISYDKNLKQYNSLKFALLKKTLQSEIV